MIKKISFVAVSAAFIFSACGSPGGSGIGSSFDTSFEMEQLASFGNSTDVMISSISNVQVASDGSAIVSDGRAPVIYVFDAEGGYQGTIGDIGQESGQFDSPPTVSLFENDSLFAFDRSMQRASIFARDGYTWTYVREFPVNMVTDDGYNVAALVKLEGLAGYVTTEVAAPTMGADGQTEEQWLRYRIIGEDGSVLNADYISRRNQQTITGDMNGAPATRVLPYGRNSFLRVEKGGDFYLGAWNDALKIDHFSADGTQLGGIEATVAERPVTDTDKTLDPRSADPRVAGKIPATHPAYVSFLVSDKGNYWVNIGQVDANSTYWVVVSPSSEILGSTLLPASIRPVRIMNGKMYAANQSSSVEPEVVVLKADF
jgi:hypothetical protein